MGAQEMRGRDERRARPLAFVLAMVFFVLVFATVGAAVAGIAHELDIDPLVGGAAAGIVSIIMMLAVCVDWT